MGNTYQHYKGAFYSKICLAEHTEDDVILVIYKDEKGHIWARPIEMFFGNVEVDGVIVPRFKKVD